MVAERFVFYRSFFGKKNGEIKIDYANMSNNIKCKSLLHYVLGLTCYDNLTCRESKAI